MTSPLGLVWWALSSHLFLVALAVIMLAVVAAVVVFGGGWS